MKALRGAAVLAFLLIAALAVAQTSKPAPQIRVATRLIQVNVIVRDKRGDPVTGLIRDDFVLLDQGEPQRVAFFSEETDHPSQPPAAPNVFSNHSQTRLGAPVSVTVILLDSLNTGFLDMGFARERVIKFLQQVHPEDRIALYALLDKLLVLHDFTQDTKALLAALDTYKNKPNAEFSASDFTFQSFGDVAANEAGNAEKIMGGRPLSDFKTVDRVSVTAAALQAIANHLAAIPGRKNLVWVSGSFPINIGTLPRRGGATKTQMFSSSAAIQDASRALNNGDLAIYPVDARGMIIETGLSEEYVFGPKVTASGLPTRGPGFQLDPPQENFTVMDQLAEDTGGRAFYNANDIDVSIRRAIDDSRDTYVLSYYPAIEKWDGSFHEIKVQVKHPGVEVRSRRGYYAFPDATPDANRQNQQIADAVAAPLASAALGLTVQADPAGTAGARKLRVHIRVDSSRMLFQQKNGRWTDHLDLVWAQIGANGQTIATSSEGLNLHMSPETYAATEKDGLKISTTLNLHDDAGALRLVARDAGTGAIGSLDIPLDKIFPMPKTPATAHP
jgi:VWFA-related protein